MADKVHIIQELYARLGEVWKQNHETQVKNIRDGVAQIRSELDSGGFHADETSEKVELLLEVIENEWISKLEQIYDHKVVVANQMIQGVAEIDVIN